MQSIDNNRQLDHTLKIATVGLILLSIVVIGFYWHSLNGKLSPKAEDWSAFGSYLGGTLGPAVSFVALIAVLRTIGLQRSAADAQHQQFTQLETLQRETLAAQQLQLKLATETAAENQVYAYKASVLKMVEHQLAFHTHIFDTLESRIDAIATFESTDTKGKLESLNKIHEERKVAEKRIKGMQSFILVFMLKQHETIDEIKMDVAQNFVSVYSDAEQP